MIFCLSSFNNQLGRTLVENSILSHNHDNSAWSNAFVLFTFWYSLHFNFYYGNQDYKWSLLFETWTHDIQLDDDYGTSICLLNHLLNMYTGKIYLFKFTCSKISTNITETWKRRKWFGYIESTFTTSFIMPRENWHGHFQIINYCNETWNFSNSSDWEK